jgi:hypothetical protein
MLDQQQKPTGSRLLARHPFLKSGGVKILPAFQLGEPGIPRFIAEFNSEADKLALLYFGQAVIAELGRSAVESVLVRCRATPMSPAEAF